MCKSHLGMLYSALDSLLETIGSGTSADSNGRTCASKNIMVDESELHMELRFK